MIGADILLKSLIEEGVKIVFGYPGGVTLPLHDRWNDYPEIQHILPRHEQGGAMAADAYFRVTGQPGVCLSTSGPGATNLVTGIANAHMDSIGMVAITCQVATTVIGSDAFQETDIIGVTIPITKQSYLVKDVKNIPKIVKEAFYLARTGRPGPVHIDLPVNVLNAKVNKFVYPDTVNLPGYNPPSTAAESDLEKMIQLIKQAKKPIVIAGHGIVLSQAQTELAKFITTAQLPTVNTLLALGSLPSDHPLNYGMLGMHGMKYANQAVHQADLIISLGSRFDDRITGKLSKFAEQAKVIHIDIDDSEIDKNVKTDLAIIGNCKDILKQLNNKIEKIEHQDWIEQLNKWQQEMHLNIIKKFTRAESSDKLLVADIVNEISQTAKQDCIVAADVGQNQMWTAQFFNCNYPGQLLNSGGLGCMGYSLPAAIGAQLAQPDRQVWALMGDGGLQMNIQELGTIMEYKLPIKIILFNNGYLGMVRQWQELFYKKNYMSTPLVNPDFIKIAQAYGIKAKKITTWNQTQVAIKEAGQNDKSIFLEFVVGGEDNVFPMMPKDGTLNQTAISKEEI